MFVCKNCGLVVRGRCVCWSLKQPFEQLDDISETAEARAALVRDLQGELATAISNLENATRENTNVQREVSILRESYKLESYKVVCLSDRIRGMSDSYFSSRYLHSVYSRWKYIVRRNRQRLRSIQSALSRRRARMLRHAFVFWKGMQKKFAAIRVSAMLGSNQRERDSSDRLLTLGWTALVSAWRGYQRRSRILQQFNRAMDSGVCARTFLAWGLMVRRRKRVWRHVESTEMAALAHLRKRFWERWFARHQYRKMLRRAFLVTERRVVGHRLDLMNVFNCWRQTARASARTIRSTLAFSRHVSSYLLGSSFRAFCLVCRRKRRNNRIAFTCQFRLRARKALNLWLALVDLSRRTRRNTEVATSNFRKLRRRMLCGSFRDWSATRASSNAATVHLRKLAQSLFAKLLATAFGDWVAYAKKSSRARGKCRGFLSKQKVESLARILRCWGRAANRAAQYSIGVQRCRTRKRMRTLKSNLFSWRQQSYRAKVLKIFALRIGAKCQREELCSWFFCWHKLLATGKHESKFSDAVERLDQETAKGQELETELQKVRMELSLLKTEYCALDKSMVEVKESLTAENSKTRSELLALADASKAKVGFFCWLILKIREP